MSNDWHDSKSFWRDKRVIVTGGAGFLGSFVVEKLQERGAAEISVPRRADYDLRDIVAIRQLLADTSLLAVSGQRSAVDMIIHLAAHVGGIGANRAKPAEFFYDNLSLRQAQDRPDDGCAATARELGGGRGKVRGTGNDLLLP